jgi:pimeloyl-ACP methyl ester carboxylesterase
MKRDLKLLVMFFLLMPLMLTQSCTKDEPNPFEGNTYLLSSKLEMMRTKENIVTLLNWGSLIYPELASMVDDIESGVNVYSITYNTSFLGQDVIASGLVIIPSAPGDYPVLSFQNGTNTLHSNAPTEDPDEQFYQMLQGVASTGYVVIISDYLGFGASDNMVHPYLHKESTVQTVVDMLYAVKEFDDDVAKDITISSDCYLMGYSQGGWATLALLDAMEHDYAADFTVRAACCGAGPYDLSYFNEHVLGLTEYPMPIFLGYIANAYNEYDLYANPLSDLFNEPYATRIPGLYDGEHTSDQINDQLTTNISELFKAVYISGYETDPSYEGVRNALTANSIEGWNSGVPLLFLHGTADTYVMPVLSEMIHTAMIDAGSNPLTCRYETMDGLDHTDGIVPAGFAGVEFFKSFR